MYQLSTLTTFHIQGYKKLKRQLLAIWRSGISMGSIGRLANFDRRPFSLEFDGIVKIFASPANWPQNAAPSSRAPSIRFMCWFYGLSSEFYVRYQMLTRIRVEVEETPTLNICPLTKQAAFIE